MRSFNWRCVRARDLTLLWGRAAGRCCHPDCKISLVLEASEDDLPATFGEAAHIVARSAPAPRGDRPYSPRLLDRYENLILLCSNHHAAVNRQPGTYTREVLRTWKLEHESWVRGVTEWGHRAVPWTVLLQEDLARMDRNEASSALPSGQEARWVHSLAVAPAAMGWEEAARVQRETVGRILAETPPERRRFAVFSLAPVPLAVQLGYLLGDRGRVALYHYHRDDGSWQWPETVKAGKVIGPRWRGRGGEVSLRVSLSAEVPCADAFAADVHIRARRPSERWLRSPEQLTALARAYGRALEWIRSRNCERIHLFYAGPAAGAVLFGRQYTPAMHPPLQLYEYRRGRRPWYCPVLLLNGA